MRVTLTADRPSSQSRGITTSVRLTRVEFFDATRRSAQPVRLMHVSLGLHRLEALHLRVPAFSPLSSHGHPLSRVVQLRCARAAALQVGRWGRAYGVSVIARTTRTQTRPALSAEAPFTKGKPARRLRTSDASCRKA